MSVNWLWQRVMMALCLVMLSSSLWSCGGTEDTEVSIGCRLNSDCAIGQVCTDGACVDGGECVGEDCPCISNADCTAGQACDAETGACFDVECSADGDCAIGDVCVKGRCETDVEADRDRDGVPDNVDNCAELENSDQEDNDGDGQGDACDDDDDNDAQPDTVDNCPFVANNSQADADGDGQGNACDDDVTGTTITGLVDTSAGGGVDPSAARVKISGVETPAVPDSDGRFVFENALPDGGRFIIRVEMTGFLPFVDEFFAAADVVEVNVGELALIPESADAATAASLQGVALLAGSEDHSGIIVSARVEGVPVATAVTDGEGAFAFPASRRPHTLNFSRLGYVETDISVVWDDEDGRFEVGGEGLEQSPVTLQALRDASLSGQLRSSIEGQDFGDAVVVLVDGEGRTRVPVEPDGSFGVSDLAAGLYGLEVEVAGHEPVRRFETLLSGANELGFIDLTPIEVEMIGRVVARVEGEDVGLDDVAVRLRREGRLVASTTSDESGVFVFRTLPVSYTLALNKAGFLPQDFDVTIEGDVFIIDGEALDLQTPLSMLQVPDIDSDTDGVPDDDDNCPAQANADQRDNDDDRAGDVCDLDDDNDALPDTIDNCPRVRNIAQGDADDDGVGNACDEDTPAITVRGVVDFSALPGANTNNAQVFLIGREEAVGIASDGSFTFEDALPEPEQFLIRVVWPGFLTAVEGYLAPDGVAELVLEPITLTPVSEGDEQSVSTSGVVRLEGLAQHGDIVVRARVEGTLVATTFTDSEGQFVMTLPPVNVTMSFDKEGFETLGVDLLYNTQGEFAGRFTRNDVPLEEIEGLVLERSTGAASVSVEVLPTWVPQGQRAVTVTVSGEGEERSAVADGAPVVFTDLPAGSYVAYARRVGFSQPLQSFVINQDQPTANVTLTVEMESLGDAGLDLSGATLTGADLRQAGRLRGANLAGARFVGVDPESAAELCDLDLSGVSLVGADLTGAILAGSDLTGARLDNASLEGAALSGANLSDVSAFGANMNSVDLSNGAYDCQGQPRDGRRTVLTSANLSGASLRGARFVAANDPQEGDPCVLAEAASPELSLVRWNQTDLSGAIMHSTALSGAEMTATLMNGADLRGACLRGATLLRVDMTDADARGANLDDLSALDALWLRADFSGASMVNASLSGVNLSEAVLDGIDGTQMSMASVIVGGASMRDALLEGSSWVGSVLNDLDLSGAALSGADMRNVQMVDVVLEGVSFDGVDLRNAGMSALDLRGLDFRGARLEGADLSQANIEGTNFSDVVLVGTRFTLARYSAETIWPSETFEYRFLTALGPETQLEGFAFPFGFDASGADLSRSSLSNTVLTGVNLRDVNLAEANLSGANLVGADLVGANLTNARLERADLSGADLSGADLSGADLGGADLSGADLSGADLSGADLGGADLSGAGLSEANLSGADLSADDVVGATDLSGADLSGAVLSGANLSSAILIGADLSGADLSEANLIGAAMRDLIGGCPTTLPEGWVCRTQPSVDGLVLLGPGANLSLADLSGADLSGVNLFGANLIRADLSGADLSGADLRAYLIGANLSGADLSGADLRAYLIGANLSGANLTGARTYDLFGCPDAVPQDWSCRSQPAADVPAELDGGGFVLLGPGADLSGANLFLANLIDADLSGANLSFANLRGVNLIGADLSDADLTGADIADAAFNGSIFSANTICPDGRPQSEFPRCGTGGGSDFSDQVLDGADFSGLDLSDSSFQSSSLVNATFINTNLSGANLIGADLSGADLSGANLSGAATHELTGGCPTTLPEGWVCRAQPSVGGFVLLGPGADLSGADLRGADLSGANLSGANLSTAQLLSADLSGADLSGADLSDASLFNANLSEADLTDAIFSDLTVCPDGTFQSAFPRCGFTGDVEPEVTPIEAQGASLTFGDALANPDLEWFRLDENCAPAGNAGHFFDVYAVVNNTGAAQVLTATAQWGLGDGFLHVFADSFDPANLPDNDFDGVIDTCVAGNDDFDDRTRSRLADIPIASGQTLFFIASAFNPGESIDGYSLTIETASQLRPEVCDGNITSIVNLDPLNGDNSQATNDHGGSCGGGTGLEEVYVFSITNDSPMCISTEGSAFDTVLYVREGDCAEGPQLVCNDDAVGLDVQSRVEVQATADTPYFVFVDGFDPASVGPYTLTLSFGPCP